MNSFLPLHTVSRLETDIMEGGEYEDNMSEVDITDDEAPKKPPPGWQIQTVKSPPELSKSAAQNVCFQHPFQKTLFSPENLPIVR